ncbi:hypothetical protein [Acinetobacter radioresistens]|uniref:hypothetical protein n=1 Tax=Acinetobacter radioresistens TaxID=40216 RepID=UPI002004623E|nr:hypothetical protein [Acinetobacter radioresistens]MCK4077497.1 hypothetical protein [Acinetobacter radioresistens]
MKPVSRKTLHSSNFLDGNFNTNFGSQNTVASIKGSIKKLGTKYSQALVFLYNKTDLLPIAIRKPDANGNYQFLGLNTDLKTFIVAFDKNKQFNAVIQDNVVPK